MKILDKNSVHLVIDIETTGTIDTVAKEGAAEILEAAFAPVFFDDHVEKWRPAGAIARKAFPPQNVPFDEKTKHWYESDPARSENLQNMRIAQTGQHAFHNGFLDILADYVKRMEARGKTIHYWSRGKDFDFPLLNIHAAQYGFEYPFNGAFHNVHCLRDLEFITSVKPDGVNKFPHRAVSDALFEAEHLAKFLNQL